MPRRDLTGVRHEMLVATRPVGRSDRGRKSEILWECQCDCGKLKVVTAGNLFTTKSCGCLKKLSHLKHGLSNTRAYGVWKMMVTRCTNPDYSHYDRYGGRGITLDPAWMDFMSFYSDMGDPPDGLTLDRIDNDGPYTKKNCRWATRKQQANNKSKTILVETPNGVMPASAAAEAHGIRYETLVYRIRTAQPMDRMFSKVRIDGRGALRERD